MRTETDKIKSCHDFIICKKPEAQENMSLRITRKGNKLLLEESEFQEYLVKKFRELVNLSTNVVAALIMISLIVVFTYFKVSDVIFFWIGYHPSYRTHFYKDNGRQVAKQTF